MKSADGSLFSDADLIVVCNAAAEHVTRLRWLGYREMMDEADEIEEAVRRLREVTKEVTS
jgi:predicted metal-dependent hydrolase